jgi:hypothetical protein
MAAAKRTVPKIYELTVELLDMKPRIWRRLLVPSAIKLPKLHDLLQLAMGWTDSHLHSFEIGARAFSSADADLRDLQMLNESKYSLAAALGDTALGEPLREFVYEYDFGDSWRHRIEVKAAARPKSDWFYPLCVAGARAAPPDDVGGVGGYREFLAAIGNPKHKEHRRMLVWVGGAFDPEGFDLNEINRALRLGPRPYGRADAVT